MITKKDLINRLVKRGRAKESEAKVIVDGIFADIEQEMLADEGYVKLVRFGNFFINEDNKPMFKPSSTMKTQLGLMYSNDCCGVDELYKQLSTTM